MLAMPSKAPRLARVAAFTIATGVNTKGFLHWVLLDGTPPS
jgi:hypothetical protein